jgi:hypothetical protein
MAKKDLDSCVLLVCEPYHLLIGVKLLQHLIEFK